jgi:predicted metal-dependent phosphoesterase TrpH
MSDSAITPETFMHGSCWLRADFHLHTKADKEFSYNGEDNNYIAEYVAGLKAAGIQIGVIANHHKFDKNEFAVLRKKARQKEIFLLPGELAESFISGLNAYSRRPDCK